LALSWLTSSVFQRLAESVGDFGVSTEILGGVGGGTAGGEEVIVSLIPPVVARNRSQLLLVLFA